MRRDWLQQTEQTQSAKHCWCKPLAEHGGRQPRTKLHSISATHEFGASRLGTGINHNSPQLLFHVSTVRLPSSRKLSPSVSRRRSMPGKRSENSVAFGVQSLSVVGKAGWGGGHGSWVMEPQITTIKWPSLAQKAQVNPCTTETCIVLDGLFMFGWGLLLL